MIIPKLSLIFTSILFNLVHGFTYTVTVGIDETNGQQGIGFDPSSIHPIAGDTIVFTFQIPEYIKKPNVTQHSATQSTFENPCTPKPGGFDTGIQSTGSAITNTGPTFSLTVNDTSPLWFFSSANTDCNGGMVLSVNPPASGDQAAAAFKEKAKTAPISTTSNNTSLSDVTTGVTSSGAEGSGTSATPPVSTGSNEALKNWRAGIWKLITLLMIGLCYLV